MVAYNHEKFIEQAIESVMMQRTNFKYKLFIGEDGSSDKTAIICKKNQLKNVDRIKLFSHEKNIGASANGIFVYNKCFESGAKYIALCEGDDYWTDPYKLQKQVDFLESNKAYSICWTKYLIKQESKNSLQLKEPDWISQVNNNQDLIIDLDNIFTPYCTYTLTALIRRETLDLDLLNKIKYPRDNSIYAMALNKGNGMLLNFYSSIYRLHDGGIYSSTSIFKQKHYSYLNTKEIASEIPNCNNDNIRSVRDYLLKESIKLHPNWFSFSYLNLIKDGINFLGLRKCLKLIFNDFKNEE